MRSVIKNFEVTWPELPGGPKVLLVLFLPVHHYFTIGKT